MTITVTHPASRRTAVVELIGEHDLSTAADLRRALLDTLDAESVVIDLEQCTFLDSTIIGVLLSAARRTGMQAVNAQGIVKKALDLTGVSDVLKLA